jgi:hypothetical protein
MTQFARSGSCKFTGPAILIGEYAMPKKTLGQELLEMDEQLDALAAAVYRGATKPARANAIRAIFELKLRVAVAAREHADPAPPSERLEKAIDEMSEYIVTSDCLYDTGVPPKVEAALLQAAKEHPEDELLQKKARRHADKAANRSKKS